MRVWKSFFDFSFPPPSPLLFSLSSPFFLFFFCSFVFFLFVCFFGGFFPLLFLLFSLFLIDSFSFSFFVTLFSFHSLFLLCFHSFSLLFSLFPPSFFPRPPLPYGSLGNFLTFFRLLALMDVLWLEQKLVYLKQQFSLSNESMNNDLKKDLMILFVFQELCV